MRQTWHLEVASVQVLGLYLHRLRLDKKRRKKVNSRKYLKRNTEYSSVYIM